MNRHHNPVWVKCGLRIYLRTLRIETGYSVKGLAKMMGYGESQLRGWEKGYIAPDSVQLIQWVEALDFKLCVAPILPRKPGEHDRKRKAEIIAEQ